MNKFSFLLMFFICFFLASSKVNAGDSLAVNATDFSLGLNISEIRNQPGAGLSISTPYFLNDKVAFRFSGMLYWIFSIPLSSASERPLHYTNLRFGAVYVAGTVAESIRLCLVGGGTYTLPGSNISDDKNIGGYLGFGVEYFTGKLTHSRLSFLFESIIILAPAIAEKLPGQPIYANGIDLSAGIKYYFSVEEFFVY